MPLQPPSLGGQPLACPGLHLLQDQVHREGWSFQRLDPIHRQPTPGEDEGV